MPLLAYNYGVTRIKKTIRRKTQAVKPLPTLIKETMPLWYHVPYNSSTILRYNTRQLAHVIPAFFVIKSLRALPTLEVHFACVMHTQLRQMHRS